MSTVRNLLRRGNGKLGEAIHTWSLPAIETCPGSTGFCRRHCYATTGRYLTAALRERLADNLVATNDPDFEHRIILEIARRCVFVLRIHVSGDFDTVPYLMKWVRIARRVRRTRFYAYTRSWRLPDMVPALTQFAALPNTRLWLSCDRETGMPAAGLVPRARVAWLEERDGEADPQAHLVFRVRAARSTPPRLTPLRLICQDERPGGDTTCSACRRCWRD